MKMFTVKTLNAIDPAGLKRLPQTDFVVDDNAEDPAAIIVRSAKMLDYVPGPGLLAVARAGAGYNNIPTDRFAELGIYVCNSPGANSNAVKELAVCALILASRNIIGGIDWCRTLAGKGDEVAPLVEKGKAQFTGPELMGKTLGLLGLGAVGAKVAKAAHSLGMTVLGCDPFLSDALKQELTGIVEMVPDQAALFARSEYLSLHLPLNADTKNTVRAETIALMPDGVRIINIARGELVCDADMAAALKSGKVSRYVTDFPNGDTVSMEGCVSIPHLGASTPESETNCAIMAADQVTEYLLRGNIVNSVNLPNVRMDRSGKYRAVILAKKDAQVSVEAAAKAEAVRGNIKAILADRDEPFNQAALADQPGVIRVRVL